MCLGLGASVPKVLPPTVSQEQILSGSLPHPLGYQPSPASPPHPCPTTAPSFHFLQVWGEVGAQPIEEGHGGSHPTQLTAPQSTWQVVGHRKAVSWRE